MDLNLGVARGVFPPDAGPKRGETFSLIAPPRFISLSMGAFSPIGLVVPGGWDEKPGPGGGPNRGVCGQNPPNYPGRSGAGPHHPKPISITLGKGGFSGGHPNHPGKSAFSPKFFPFCPPGDHPRGKGEKKNPFNKFFYRKKSSSPIKTLKEQKKILLTKPYHRHMISIPPQQ